MSSINSNEITKPTLRKVTIMTTGSRGDIQPFVAIGIALKRAGFAVRILASPSETHQKLCNDLGLEHVPFGIDSDAFMRDDEACRASMEQGDVLNFFKCIAGIVSKRPETICGPFYDEVITGKHRPDFLIVSFLNRFFGLYAKHVLNIPTIEIKMQHWVFDDPSRAPMGMPTLPLGLHRSIQTKLMIPQDYKNFKTFDKCTADIIASKAGTATTTTIRIEDFLLYDQFFDSEVNHSPLLPLFVTQSPLFKEVLCPLVPTSPNFRYVGAPIIETTDQVDKDAPSFGGDSSKTKLEAFLASDPSRKPIYMGWGSMIRKSTHEMVLFAVETLRNSHQRGIVLGGMAGLSMELLEEAVASSDNDGGEQILEYAKENILFVDKAPHEWLFPQVSLTVHHGGAGTTNSALRAGVPTIVTPVFADQYDQAFVVQKLGAGFGFDKKLQDIDANDLSKTIDAVLKDPAIVNRAKRVGAKLRNENGCKAIVEEVETYWRETVTSGKFMTDVQNWKAATKELKSSNEKKTLRNRVAVGSALAVAIIAFLVK